jgi:hypothetical protein
MEAVRDWSVVLAVCGQARVLWSAKRVEILFATHDFSYAGSFSGQSIGPH